jgi:hypothetical protein
LYAYARYYSSWNNTSKTLYRITASWGENNVTWNNKPSFSNSGGVQNSNSSLQVWEDYTVTSFIKSIIEDNVQNYGFLLKMSESSYRSVNIYSSEYNTAESRPKLEITYETGDNLAPTVSVTAPTAGESIMGGTTYTIRWNAQDDVGVVSRAIYLVSALSSIEPLIDSASGNTGTFQWTVPDESIQDCKIQVFAYDAAGNQGKGESGNFSIDIVNIVNPHFSLPAADKYLVLVRNLQGRMLAQYEINDIKQLTEIKSLYPSGMHVISISTPDGFINRRFYTVK